MNKLPPNSSCKAISPRALLELRRLEGLRLKMYRCEAGRPTIGFGHTGPDVVEGMVITAERAEELLRADVFRFERCINNAVKVELTPWQFDALVLWAFNVGESAAAYSTLVRNHLNRDGDLIAAANELLIWKYAKGKVSAILSNRRVRERSMFLAGLGVV